MIARPDHPSSSIPSGESTVGRRDRFRRIRTPAPRRAFADGLRALASHAPVLVPAAALLVVGSWVLAVAWFLASRLAYVLFVGISLRATEVRIGSLGPDGDEDALRRFRSRASWLMDNDAVAFATLCLVTAGTLPFPGPRWVTVTTGVAMVVVGIGVKVWANASLPRGSYYWRNFFIPSARSVNPPGGPYRWMTSPMYTAGYAHAYGFALITASWAGVLGAIFAQGAILLLDVLVEQPHFRRMPSAA